MVFTVRQFQQAICDEMILCARPRPAWLHQGHSAGTRTGCVLLRSEI